jgi:hypothetical protein
VDDRTNPLTSPFAKPSSAMNQTPPRKLTGMTIALLILVWVISAPIMAYLSFRVWVWLYFNPGRFDRKKMNAIVDVVRHQDFDAEQIATFQIDDLANPGSLHVAERSGLRKIWAVRTESGALKVSIMTKDRGHFGWFGFAYSDVALQPETIQGRKFLDVPEMSDPMTRIDDHWWKVFMSR